MKEVSLEQRANQSTYIVEGKVINQTPFWNPQHTLIYTAYIVDVYKILKGSGTPSRIELIAQGGQLDGKWHVLNPNINLSPGMTGIFFCQPSTITNSPNVIPVNFKFSLYALSQGTVLYNEINGTASEPFHTYSDVKNELYDKISQLSGTSYKQVKSYNLERIVSENNKNNVSRATPVITSFSPNPITAGTGSILTINGSNFGGTAGSVKFKDADDGGASYLTSTSTDIVSWTDTQIQVKVFQKAGTGTIQVTNSTSQTGTSSSDLTITYNLTNAGTPKARTNLINLNGTGGYTYKYSTNTANGGVSFDGHATAKAAFQRALESWRCNTGFNVMDAGTTTVNSESDDGTSTVMFDNNSDALSAGVLGTGYSFFTNCGSGWQASDIDIKFRRDGTDGTTWEFGTANPSAGESDFESVAVHELGHNHQLGHVINDGKVMHYSLTTGTTARVLDNTVDIDAGVDVINYSASYSGCGETGMTSYNCNSAPIADFSGSPTSGCSSTLTVNFTDNCQYQPTGWEWSFPGGSPSSSTDQNPSGIIYNASGTYTVTLIATNGIGSDTVTKTDYIQVGGGAMPFSEDFETGVIPPSGWSLNNADGSKTWKDTTITGHTGSSTHVGYINHFEYNVNTGTLDELSSSKITIPSSAVASLSFYVAYARYDASNFERLRVLLSTDCGSTFPNVIYNKSGDDADGNTLPTAGSNKTTEWVPTTSGEWRKETIDLSAYANNTIMLKFESTNGYGNNMFIDDISVAENSLSLSISGTNISCDGGNNGSANLTVSGGTSPYSYAWSNSTTTEDISSLTAGTYTVTVTDATSTTKSASVTLSQPTALTISVTGTNPSCNGGTNGTATATPGGGTGAYSYLWNTGQTTSTRTSLSAGTYTVTVTDANSCTISGSVTLTNPTVVTATVTGTNPSCNGGANGTATVVGAGGTGTFTYLWSNAATTSTISGLSAGTYTATVTDGKSCTATGNVSLSNPTAVTASVTGTNPSCNGGTNGKATVAGAGGTGTFTYMWSTGATTSTISGLAAGTYTATVTDANSCTISGSVTLTNPTTVTATVTGTNPVCNGGATGTATVTGAGGTAIFTYLWSIAATTSTISGLPAGTYTATVTDGNNCTASANVTLTDPTALTLSVNGTNPDCNGGTNGSVTATPAGGTPAYTYAWDGGAITQTVSSLSDGTFTVTVTDAKSCTISGNVTLTNSTAVTATVTGTNPSCNGDTNGSVTASGGGGTGVYTFLWSTGSTNIKILAIGAGTYSVTVTDENSCTASGEITLTEPTILTTTISGSNPSCNGSSDGSATATTTGGTSAYIFNWSEGSVTSTVSNLSDGLFSVTVTDANSCTATASTTLTSPSLLTISVTGNNPTCTVNDGSATATAGGGTLSYSYSWNDGQSTATATSLSAGTYSVTVSDANSCTTSNEVTLTLSSLLTVSITQTNISCNGVNDGSADAIPSGGLSPYTYLWSSLQTSATITNLTTGSYTVTVTDNNACTQSASLTITEPTVLDATVNTQQPSCNGGNDGAAQVIASGGITPYTYSWTTGELTQIVTGLLAGPGGVTVTDANNCQVIKLGNLSEPTAITLTISMQNDVLCKGDSTGSTTITPTGGTPGYTYLWSSPGNPTTQTISVLFSGSYIVTVTDANNCTATEQVTITEPGSNVTVSLSNTDVTCNSGTDGSIIATVTGGISPYSYLWNDGVTTQNRIALLSGTYSLTVTDSNGCTVISSDTVLQPTAISLSFSATDANCSSNDGSVTVTATGGTAGYTYLWNDLSSQTTSTAVTLSAGIYNVTVTDLNGCTATGNGIIGNVGGPTLSSVIDSVNCFSGSDGAVDLIVSGGTSPYTFNWSDAVTTEDRAGLGAGTYSVTITDNLGCLAMHVAQVKEPLLLTISQQSVTHHACHGDLSGGADVLVSGGSSPYTMSWNNSITTSSISNVPGGIYSVTVTDINSCTSSLSITINEPDSLVFSITTTNPDCFGNDNGIVAINTSSGGTLPYFASLNTTSYDTIYSFGNLAPGSYTIDYKDDNGCTAVQQGAVLNYTTAVLANADQDVCSSTPTFSIASGTPIGGVWSGTGVIDAVNGTFDPAVSGVGSFTLTYSITEGTSTCTDTKQMIVTAAPFADAGPDPSDICEGSTVTLSGTATNGTVAWSGGAGTFTNVTNDTTDYISGVEAGSVTLTMTVSNFSCPDATDQVTLNILSMPFANAGSNVSICQNNSIVLSGTALNGTVLWTGGSGSYSNVNSAMTTYNSGVESGNITLTMTVSNTPCADAVDSVNVTISTPEPAPLVNCGTTTISTIEWVWNSLPGAIGYEISRDGGTTWLTSTGLSEDTTGLSPGEALTLSVRGVFAGDCIYSEMSSKTCFSINCTPRVVTVSNDTTICQGSSATIGVLDVTGGTGNYSYSWSGPDSLAEVAGPHIVSQFTNSTYTVYVTDEGELSCGVVTKSIFVNVNSGLSLSLGSENETCSGNSDGSATVSVTGNSGTLNYLWSNSGTDSLITGLSAGTYTCTVTDDNTLCQASVSVDILPANALSGSLTITNVTCNGDSDGVILATVSGGVGGYTYTWNTLPTQYDSVVSNLPAGNYSVSIYDANNCQLLLDGAVNDAPFTISFTTSDISCFGGSDGSVISTVSGGASPFSYFWNTTETTSSINNLTAGTYTLAVTDANSCSDTLDVIINQPPMLTVSVTGTNPDCNGGANGSAIATASGGTSPYNYIWSEGQVTPTALNLSAGTYTTTVTDVNGCTSSANIAITQPSSISLTLSSNNPTGCFNNNGSIITISSGGISPYIYNWSDGTTSSSISGLSAGVYSVTITDSNGCTNSASATLTSPNSPTISVSGTNPFCNGSTNGSATAVAGGGTSPYQYVWITGANTSLISSISDGTYSVTVTDANSCTSSGSVTLTGPVSLTGTLSATNVTCNGLANGSIISNVSGGTPGYSYLWSSAGTTSTVTGLISGTHTVTATDSKSCTLTLSIAVTQPMALNLTISKTDPACSLANGSAIATVSGGTSPYSYLWSNTVTLSSISNVTAGAYTVTVTDANGCTVSKSSNLSNLSGPTAFTSGTNVTCNGGTDGTVTATLSGGISPYTYLWSAGQNTAVISGLSAGVYTVTITDNNSCTSTSAINLSQPSPLTVSKLSSSDVSCAGNADGSISVTASGGNGTYTYLWNDGQSTSTAGSLTANTYTVTVTDIKGCNASANFTISTGTGITLSVSTSSPTCYNSTNGSASVFPSSGTGPFSYSWNTGETAQFISNLSAGDYFVTATDSKQCTVVENVVITAPAIPTVDFSADVTLIDSGGVVNFTNLSPSVISSTWYFGDGDSSVATAPSHQYDTVGIFSVTLKITTSSFCNNTLVKTDYIKVDKLINIAETINSGKISLYPVPANKYLIVSGPSQYVNGKFSIVDITGKEILKINSTSITKIPSSSESNYRLDISSLSEGFYLLKIVSDTGVKTLGFQRVE